MNFGWKNTARNRLVCEDISPILRTNHSQNRVPQFDSPSNLRKSDDSDDTKELVIQLKTVNINNEDTDDYKTAGSDVEVNNKE